MSIPIKEFYYGQTSAPPMAGTVGYMISILDAVLVNGFNSKSVSSLVVSSNVATVTTSTSHGYEIGTRLLFAGANESIFNDEFEILTIPATNQFTFAITTADATATGTITCKVAPLGWEKSFSGTNKAVYRSLDVTSNRLYLRVDDTNAQYATVNIYETMSSVDVGTGASTTKYWKKSSTSDTTARPWYAVGNKKVFYFLSDWHATSVLQPCGYVFGDIISYKSGDGYNTMLIGHDVSNPSGQYANNNFSKIGVSSETEGQILDRSYTQLGSNITFYKYSGINGHSYMGNDTTYAFPNPVDNGVHLFPVYVYETGNSLRGKMPGLWCPNEYTNGLFYSRDTTVIVDGKRYISYRICNSNGTNQYGNCWFSLDEDWT